MEQIEKLYTFFELNLDIEEIQKVLKIKRTFNNDLNLIGCFIKDFLILELSTNNIKDDNIYNDFVILFDKKENKINFIDKLYSYSKYYQILMYEDTKDRVLLSTIASVNSCYAIEYYPFLMELIDKYINKKIDSISYALMLQFISDNVFKDFELSAQSKLDINTLRKKLEEYLEEGKERLAI